MLNSELDWLIDLCVAKCWVPPGLVQNINVGETAIMMIIK